jgi:hypothetical protein
MSEKKSLLQTTMELTAGALAIGTLLGSPDSAIAKTHNRDFVSKFDTPTQVAQVENSKTLKIERYTFGDSSIEVTYDSDEDFKRLQFSINQINNNPYIKKHGVIAELGPIHLTGPAQTTIEFNYSKPLSLRQEDDVKNIVENNLDMAVTGRRF